MRTLNKRSYGVYVHSVHSNQRNKRSYGVYVYSVHKYNPERWNFMSEGKSHDLDQITCILRFYLEETISSCLVNN